MHDDDKPLLKVRNLRLSFGSDVVVHDLSFSVLRGETLAIVGESGSGKSVSSLAVLGLLKHVGGQILAGSVEFDGQDLVGLGEKALRAIRGNRISMIFQEPMTSLDPVFTIGNQIEESLRLHRGLRGADASREAARLLDLVRLPDAKDQLRRYPHQLSGGMRQRVMIAIALACQPDLLIADEPTTALDVTIQAQILQIIRDMQAEFGTSVIFISHDMGVVSQMANRVVVMKGWPHGRGGGSARRDPYTLRRLHPPADGRRAAFGCDDRSGPAREVRPAGDRDHGRAPACSERRTARGARWGDDALRRHLWVPWPCHAPGPRRREHQLRDPSRRDAGPRRRVRIRQVHRRQDAAAACRAGRGPDPVPRDRHAVAGSGGPAAVPQGNPVRIPGPLRLAQPAQDGAAEPDRADAGARAADRSEAAGGGTAGIGRSGAKLRRSLSA